MTANALSKIVLVVSIIVLIIIATTLFLVLNPLGLTTGVGNTQSTTQTNDSQSGGLFAANEWPQDETTADVPIPQFHAKPSKVQTDNSGLASVNYDNLSEQDIMGFIEQLKHAGFTHNSHESKSSNSYDYSASNKADGGFVGTTVIVSYKSTGATHISINNYDVAMASIQQEMRGNSE